MKIITTHTLTFVVQTTGDERHKAAMVIITQGAAGFDLDASVASMPLSDGSDPGLRKTEVKVVGTSQPDLEVYWTRASEALEFIGVEVRQ